MRVAHERNVAIQAACVGWPRITAELGSGVAGAGGAKRISAPDISPKQHWGSMDVVGNIRARAWIAMRSVSGSTSEGVLVPGSPRHRGNIVADADLRAAFREAIGELHVETGQLPRIGKPPVVVSEMVLQVHHPYPGERCIPVQSGAAGLAAPHQSGHKVVKRVILADERSGGDRCRCVRRCHSPVPDHHAAPFLNAPRQNPATACPNSGWPQHDHQVWSQKGERCFCATARADGADSINYKQFQRLAGYPPARSHGACCMPLRQVRQAGFMLSAYSGI